jgi:transposase-like protein
MLCVRWYLRFKLSFRDLVEMMAERGLSMSHLSTFASASGAMSPRRKRSFARQ